MNVPVPPIFLYEFDYSKYEVMDGLQRLTAIHEFYRNRYALTGLVEWPELNGRTYEQLPTKVREGIDRRYLSSVILLKETAHSEEDALRLKQLVFERINSGGVAFSAGITQRALRRPYEPALHPALQGPSALPTVGYPRAGAARARWWLTVRRTHQETMISGR